MDLLDCIEAAGVRVEGSKDRAADSAADHLAESPLLQTCISVDHVVFDDTFFSFLKEKRDVADN